ncbi:MAG TPA: hypothetical protein VF883_05485 [Thermoanaerobaculia bacterium]|jgi:hypothetical protein
MNVEATLLFERLHVARAVYALVGQQEAVRLKHDGMPLWYGDADVVADAPMPRIVELDQRLAKRVYRESAGTFVLADADTGTVRQSLFAFSAAERVDGTLRMLPFHDPAIFPVFLEGLAREDVERLFAAVEAFATPRVEDEHLLVFRYEPPRVTASAVHLATGWSREWSWEPLPWQARVEMPLPADEPQQGGAPRITQRQMEALRAAGIRDRIGAPPGMRRAAVVFPQLTAPGEARLEEALDARLMHDVAANLRQYAPEAVQPLSVPDLEAMLETALRRARGRGLEDRGRMFEFAKLMFVIAPGFDRHPVIERILGGDTGTPDERFTRAIETMTYADWERAQKLYDPRDWELPELR